MTCTGFLRNKHALCALVLMLLCVLRPTVAFAESTGGGGWDDDAVIYGPEYINVATGERGVWVYSGNKFNAALTTLGYNSYDDKFTDQVKSYLSSASTGGSFYEFANLFRTGRPEPSLGLLREGWEAAWYSSVMIYPESDVFGAIFDESLYNSAKQRVEDVLAGNTGGGEEPVSSYTTIEFTPFDATLYNFQSLDAPSYYRNTNYYVYKLGDVPYYGQDMANVYGNLASRYNVGILSTWYTDLMNQVDGLGWSDSIVIAKLVGLYAGGFTISFNVYHKSQLSLYEDVNGNVVGFRYPVGEQYVSVTSAPTKVYAPDPWPNSLNDLPNYLKYEGRRVILSSPRTFTGYEGTPGIIWSTYDIAYAYITRGGDWPDDPPVVAPTPPELPTPHDPVIPNPPVDPTPPEPPTYITQPVYVTNNFTVDLQGILDALDEHCQHLQNALYSDLKSLNDNVIAKLGAEGSTTRSLISERFNWLGMVLGECFETLDDDIYDYFHWLAAQFDFQSGGGYNDNTVIAWLKRIYARLGKGPFNTRPVDPVADPFGFDDWLNALWNQFIMFLQSLLGGAISPIAVAIGALADNFPFCLPWDMMAMLGLLVAVPVAPNFDIPIYYLTDSGVQSSMQHVDLSPWTPYLGPLQLLFTILFVKQLIHLTPKVMQFFNVAGGE